jgi:diguanylate cyclase (GGDEF)-like protein
VNDRWGHTAGDGLLREVARRILAEVRDDDLVARIGGDEFGVLLWGVDEVVAESVAERLRAACRTPVWLPGLDEPIEVGISVGVASDVAALAAHTVERADAALYREKRRTRGPA